MLERLQKIIARAGIASRRHAEQLILSGQVRVNGEVVTELGSKADPERDRIEAAGRPVRFPASKSYLLLHKPSQVVSTMADPEGRKSLRNFLAGVPGRVFPVGRLDYAASGLVLLTSDGELANRILKAAARLPQTYWIKVKGRVGDDQLRRLAQEAHAKIHPLRAPHAAGRHAANPWYEVTLTEARRDVLRRKLVALGHPVEKLKRVRLANLDLGALPEGHYRHLEPAEVAALERAIRRAGQPERGPHTGMHHQKFTDRRARSASGAGA
ncbi:MAG: rRNA pseudouridine synthase [Acidobacteria bacterium]|nr:rRNA pseudouridine synthase [Acidobacteriota bacterium]